MLSKKTTCVTFDMLSPLHVNLIPILYITRPYFNITNITLDEESDPNTLTMVGEHRSTLSQ